MKCNKLIAAEYVIIGGGPAAICAVAKLLGSGVAGHKIIWVDPLFKVGDFGTKLSQGTSVPGNSTVASYKRTFEGIYSLIPASKPTSEQQKKFEFTSLSNQTTCALSVAAEILEHISVHLRSMVHAVLGTIPALYTTNAGIRIEIRSDRNSPEYLMTKRVILAVGAEPKTILLPKHINIIPPHIAFIKSELSEYLNSHSSTTSVAVIGSSHSAALATMHLLQAGKPVKQFMNKNYKFATPILGADGGIYTQYDNTGLKGEVALFTRELLQTNPTESNWRCYIGETNPFFITQLSQCTDAVICIGYRAASSLKINNLPLSDFSYDTHTTQILDPKGEAIPGIFGIGIAYPPLVKAITGEVEFSVGVEKFWINISDSVLADWDYHPAMQYSIL